MINLTISGGTVHQEEGGLKGVADLTVESLTKEDLGSKLEELAVTVNANLLTSLLRSGRRCSQVCNQKSSQF